VLSKYLQINGIQNYAAGIDISVLTTLSFPELKLIINVKKHVGIFWQLLESRLKLRLGFYFSVT
jgi:hypothetical protein